MIVAMLAAVAAAPALAPDETAATTEDDRLYTAEDMADAYGFTPMFWAGLAVGLAFAAGFGIGAAAVYLTEPKDGAGSNNPDQAKLNAEFKQLEAEKVTYAGDTALHLVTSVMPADTQLWAFTSAYWQRAAEYAVCDNWSTDNKYDADAVLELTGLPHNASNYLYSWSEAVDEAYNSLAAHATKWDNSPYTELAMSLTCGGTTLLSSGSAATGSTKLGLDLCQAIAATNDVKTVYVDTDYTDTGQTYTYYQTIYAFGSASTYTVTNAATGVSYTLLQGANAITHVLNQKTSEYGTLPSGTYTLTAGATYAGPLCAVTGSTGAVTGCLVMTQGSSLCYALSAGSGSAKIYNSNGSLRTTASDLELTVTGGSSTETTYLIGKDSTYTYDILNCYSELVQEIGVVVGQAATAAKVEWSIFDACQTSSLYISPSSITNQIADHTVTAAEATALAIQQMAQIADYYKNNQTKLDDCDIIADLGSLSLTCFGTIYYNGTAIATNVAFTPYITSSAETLQVGTNTWAGSGFAMVWGAASTYTSQSASQYCLVDLSDGYTIEITKIVKDGASVSSVDLTKLTIQKYGNGGAGAGDDTQPVPTLQDCRVLYVIIVIELAAILCLLGYITNVPLFYLGAVVALVAVTVWYYWSDITSWWSGLWSWI